MRTQVTILRPFPYSEDGVTVRGLEVAASEAVLAAYVPGLIAEGYVEVENDVARAFGFDDAPPPAAAAEDPPAPEAPAPVEPAPAPFVPAPRQSKRKGR
ncbi:MAG: hypothetical protein KA105_02775 [Caulobacter sp.]|nr:hypothetical protein [Caulobacter sp.]